MYVQFLNEDVHSLKSIGENAASQIEQLLKEAMERLRESVNLLSPEVRGKKR